MTRKEELFYLIRSLGKNEKRHFRLFSSSTGESPNYLRLFDAIDGQERYDEAAIRAQFEGEKFIRQLTTTKNYLRNLILKSLRNYHSAISRSAELRDILRNVEILYHKGLFRLCRSEIGRGKRIAEACEDFTALYELRTWERKVIQAIDPYDLRGMSNVIEQQEECLTHAQRHITWWKANLEPITDEHEPAGIDPDDPLSIRVMQHLYNSQLHMVRARPEQARSSLMELLALLEERSDYAANDPNLYASVSNNLIAFHVYEKRYDEALALAAKVKELLLSRNPGSAQSMKSLLRTFNVELEVYRNTRDLARASGLIEQIATLIARRRIIVPFPYLLSFWFQFAYIHFLGANYRESLTWLNRILNEKEARDQYDIYTPACWLNLMIHAELRNYSVLGYFVEGMKRFLTRRRSIQPYEKLLLGFFSRIARCPEGEVRNEFRALNRLLRSDPASAIPEGMLYFVDFHAWVEGKINSIRRGRQNSKLVEDSEQ